MYTECGYAVRTPGEQQHVSVRGLVTIGCCKRVIGGGCSRMGRCGELLLRHGDESHLLCLPTAPRSHGGPAHSGTMRVLHAHCCAAPKSRPSSPCVCCSARQANTLGGLPFLNGANELYLSSVYQGSFLFGVASFVKAMWTVQPMPLVLWHVRMTSMWHVQPPFKSMAAWRTTL